MPFIIIGKRAYIGTGYALLPNTILQRHRYTSLIGNTMVPR